MKKLITLLAFALAFIPSARADYDFTKMIQVVPLSAKFEDPGFIVWCGTMVRDEQGKCHLFYSRWPRALGHYAWVTHSEIAHAVADHPLGPYKFVGVALPERGADKWDGLCTHNPTVMKFGNKYFENGEPAVLFCAAAPPRKIDESYNVQIPLKPALRKP